MSNVFIISALLAGAGIGVAVFYFLKKGASKDAGAGQAFLMLQNQLNELRNAVDQKMGESTKIMQHQFGESAKIIKDITQELVRVGEGQKQVMSITDQLKNLQEKMPEQEAEIFIGLKGMRAAYTKLAAGNKGGEWLFFYIHEQDYSQTADRFYLSIKDILKIPDATKGIGDIEAKKSKFTKYASKKLVDYRFVDFPLPGNIDIYKNKVLLQAWSENPVAFLIKSPLITSLLTGYFESVWKIAKK